MDHEKALEVFYRYCPFTAPVDVHRVLEGLEIGLESSSSLQEAYSFDRANNKITRCTALSKEWRRFALAHALGIALTSNISYFAVRDRFLRGGISGEATRFACSLLMPGVLLDESVAYHRRSSIDELARAFSVPHKIASLQVSVLLGYYVEW
jgi:Zn-dependent peptidase ImmA (M78 family)